MPDMKYQCAKCGKTADGDFGDCTECGNSHLIARHSGSHNTMSYKLVMKHLNDLAALTCEYKPAEGDSIVVVRVEYERVVEILRQTSMAIMMIEHGYREELDGHMDEIKRLMGKSGSGRPDRPSPPPPMAQPRTRG